LADREGSADNAALLVLALRREIGHATAVGIKWLNFVRGPATAKGVVVSAIATEYVARSVAAAFKEEAIWATTGFHFKNVADQSEGNHK
jgi:hypothetical protein